MTLLLFKNEVATDMHRCTHYLECCGYQLPRALIVLFHTRFSNHTSASFPQDCRLCVAGTYSTELGATSCKDCAPGKLSSGDRSFCKDCSAGEYVNNGLSCEKCTFGKYAPSAQQDACLSCGAGSRTSNTTGSESCSICDAGSYSEGGVDACTPCGVGHWSPSGQSACVACSKGTFAAQAGASSCTQCGAGTYGPSLGATGCVDCPAGYAESRTAQEACTECTIGRFAEATGSTGCEACPTGFSSAPGHTEACLTCADYYFDRDDETETADCVECTGAFSGLDCTGANAGSDLSTITLRPGFWRVGIESTHILSCPDPSFCAGGSDPEDYCAAGHRGPYCAECDRDFYKWGGACYACEGDNSSARWAMPLAFVLVVLVAIAVVVAVGGCAGEKQAGAGGSEGGWAQWLRSGGVFASLSPEATLHMKNVAKTTFVTVSGGPWACGAVPDTIKSVLRFNQLPRPFI